MADSQWHFHLISVKIGITFVSKSNSKQALPQWRLMQQIRAGQLISCIFKGLSFLLCNSLIHLLLSRRWQMPRFPVILLWGSMDMPFVALWGGGFMFHRVDFTLGGGEVWLPWWRNSRINRSSFSAKTKNFWDGGRSSITTGHNSRNTQGCENKAEIPPR